MVRHGPATPLKIAAPCAFLIDPQIVEAVKRNAKPRPVGASTTERGQGDLRAFRGIGSPNLFTGLIPLARFTLNAVTGLLPRSAFPWRDRRGLHGLCWLLLCPRRGRSRARNP